MKNQSHVLYVRVISSSALVAGRAALSNTYWKSSGYINVSFCCSRQLSSPPCNDIPWSVNLSIHLFRSHFPSPPASLGRMFSFIRLSFVFFCYAVISTILLSSSSFALAIASQDSVNDEISLFDINDGSSSSLFSEEPDTQLTSNPSSPIFPSITDDDNTSLFLPDSSPISTTPLDSPTDQDLVLAATNNDECVSVTDQFIIGKKIRQNDICNPGTTAPAAVEFTWAMNLPSFPSFSS